MQRIWVIAFICLVIGCGTHSGPGVLSTMGSKIKGEFYLESEKYDQGIAAFQQQVSQNSSDATAHYYLGRFYLIKKNAAGAIDHLSKAVLLFPDHADYHFWLGVAYSAAKQPKAERASYSRALALDNQHQQALLYLSHNQMNAGEYKAALDGYTRLLMRAPKNPQALYNRALILRTLRRSSEANAAWKTYLNAYQSGPFARQAADYLNEGGDFGYRNHLIGKRSQTLKQVTFDPITLAIEKQSLSDLNLLGKFLTDHPRTVLHVVVYQKNALTLSQKKAKAIKLKLLSDHSKVRSDQIRISWFDTAAKVKINDRTVRSDHLIQFFTLEQ